MIVISELLPHDADMVLLDEVLSVAGTKIECRTNSHQLPTNPLRCGDGLPISAGLEYGAQAVALHGILNKSAFEKAKQARIISVKTAQWTVNWLHKIEAPLIVTANVVTNLETLAHYSFQITAESHPEVIYKAEVSVLLN